MKWLLRVEVSKLPAPQCQYRTCHCVLNQLWMHVCISRAFFPPGRDKTIYVIRLSPNICYFVANQRFANHCQTLKPSKCKSSAIIKSTHREWGRRLLQNVWLSAIVVFPVMIWNRDGGQIWRQETGWGDFYRNLLSSRHACWSRKRTFLNSENMTFASRRACILLKITESCSKRENTPNLGQLWDNLETTLGQH